MKTPLRIIQEAIIVGIFQILFFVIIDYSMKDKHIYLKLFATGVLFHVVFEYTYINKWYSLDYMTHI